MQKVFGNITSFAIKYSFDNTKDDNVLPMFNLEFWVKGKELLTYNYKNVRYGYFGEIQNIISWFYDKIEYLIGYDPFPLPVNHEDINSMIKSADEYDNDNDMEFDLWFAAKSRWTFNHCWFSARTDSIIPCVYFSRDNDLMEIAWNNSFWENDGVIFENKIGFEKIEYNTFVNVLIPFLKDLQNILVDYGYDFGKNNSFLN